MTEEGIDRDLAAMAFIHAVQNANKHGIKLGFPNCPGWSESGGPWITPDNSMKVVVVSETDAPVIAHDIPRCA